MQLEVQLASVCRSVGCKSRAVVVADVGVLGVVIVAVVALFWC